MWSRNADVFSGLDFSWTGDLKQSVEATNTTFSGLLRRRTTRLNLNVLFKSQHLRCYVGAITVTFVRALLMLNNIDRFWSKIDAIWTGLQQDGPTVVSSHSVQFLLTFYSHWDFLAKGLMNVCHGEASAICLHFKIHIWITLAPNDYLMGLQNNSNQVHICCLRWFMKVWDTVSLTCFYIIDI